MKKIVIFVILSLLFHSLLLLIEVKPPSKKSQPTKIEIVPKEEVQPTPPPLPEAPQELSSSEQMLPNTPDPQVPAEVAPEPQLPEEVPLPPQEAMVPQETPLPPLIVPESYNPDNPPAPFSFREMLEEQMQAANPQGPDRRIDDVVREYLEEQGTPDDAVSFYNMSSKYDSYFYKFARSLYGEWKYPIEAAQRGEKGIVRVTFSITKEGKIINISLLESSGYPVLDREVLRTLREMAPVPLPDSYEPALMNINGYFIYTQSGHYRLY